MPYEFCLPAGIAEPGADVFVVNWFKDEGAPVKQGQLLLEVQVDKVATEVQAPADAVLVQILCPAGAVTQAGRPLCLLAAPAEADAPAVTATPPPPAPTGQSEEIRATPAARRLARELGIDLAAVAGTGPGGRISEDDVGAQSGTAAERREQLSPTQRVSAERLVSSLRETAPFTLGREVDVGTLVALRAQVKAEGSPVTLSDLLHRAVVLALAKHPRLQAQLDGHTLVFPNATHLAFAVARDEDLLAPVIRDAHTRSLRDLAAERRRLSTAALAKTLQPAELTGATFTVSNLGSYGVDFFTPLLTPPQSAILGAGRVALRPTWRDGAAVPAHLLTLSLTVDHRISNGAPAAAFLGTLAELLAAPGDWAGLG